MKSQNQSQSFTLRIADSEAAHFTNGHNQCRAVAESDTQTRGGLTSGSSTATIDLVAAYRSSRVAAQQSLSSMRIGPSRFGSTSSYRMAG